MPRGQLCGGLEVLTDRDFPSQPLRTGISPSCILFHCLLSPLWSPSKKTPLLQNTPGELQRSLTSLCLPFPRPQSQHSHHLLSPSRPSASQRSPLNCIQRRAGFRRDAPKPSHCFPLPPTASHSLSLPSHCLPLSSRWAHLNTASPWDSTGGTQ